MSKVNPAVRRRRRRHLTVILIWLLALLSSVFVLAQLIVYRAGQDHKSYDIDVMAAELTEPVDAILVLGASVRPQGVSAMLADRLELAIRAHEAGLSDRILVSGDHGSPYYDEVNAMRDYLLERGIPSKNIFMDHAGFNTYDSIARAQSVFGAETVLICTQNYHMYRALYLAEELDLMAWGYAAKNKLNQRPLYNQAREALARVKAVAEAEVLPAKTYSDSPVDLRGSGEVTLSPIP